MNRRFLRNTVFGTATALSTTLGAFLVSLVVARLLGVAQTGSFTLALWVVATSATVTGAGLPFTLSRFLPEIADLDGPGQARALAGFLLPRALLLSLAPAAALAIYAVWLALRAAPGPAAHAPPGPIGLQDPICWLLTGLACAATGAANFARGYLRGIHSLHRVAMLNSAAAMVQIACITAGTLLWGMRGALAGYLAGAMLPCLALLDLRQVVPGASLALRHRIASYTRYRWASEVAAAFVFSRIELFFLQVTGNAHDVGLFAVALTLSNLATQLPLMLTWGLLPRMAEQFGQRDSASLGATYATGTRLLAFFVFPACAGTAAIIPDLLPRLYGHAFAGAGPAAIVLVLAASLSATSAIGSNLLWAMEKTDMDLYFGLAGAAVSLAIGLPLIAQGGLMGAAVARVLTQLTVVGLAAWYIVRKAGFALPVASLGRIALAALACGAVARFTLLSVPGAVGLAAAVVLGALTYVRLTSLLAALDPADVEKISSLTRHFPKSFGSAGHRLIHAAFGPGGASTSAQSQALAGTVGDRQGR